MIEISEQPKSDVIELRIGKDVSKEEFKTVLEELEEMFADRDEIRILEDVQQIPSFDPSMIWEDLKFTLKHMDDISHCAVVSDLGWVGPYARIAGALSQCQIRVFPSDQKEKARTWLNEAE